MFLSSFPIFILVYETEGSGCVGFGVVLSSVPQGKKPYLDLK